MPGATRRHPHPRLRSAAIRFLIATLLLLVAAMATHLTILAVLCAISAMACLWLWISSMKRNDDASAGRRSREPDGRP